MRIASGRTASTAAPGARPRSGTSRVVPPSETSPIPSRDRASVTGSRLALPMKSAMKRVAGRWYRSRGVPLAGALPGPLHMDAALLLERGGGGAAPLLVHAAIDDDAACGVRPRAA